jgi:hypothetical protein
VRDLAGISIARLSFPCNSGGEVMRLRAGLNGGSRSRAHRAAEPDDAIPAIGRAEAHP